MTRHKVVGIYRTWPAVFLIGLLLGSGCSSASDTAVGASDLQAPHTNSQPMYRLTAGSPSAPTKSENRREFALLASGTENARIIDQDREVIRSAPSDGTIFSFQTSPDGKYILLNFGSAKYSIASTETLDDLTTLPRLPPIQDDVTGFRWFFLDDAHLFGASQLRSTDTEGRMASEIDSLLPRATLLYIYALEGGTLTPVEIDDTLPSVFSIHDVSGWNVTILTYEDDLLGAKIVRVPAAGDTNPP